MEPMETETYTSHFNVKLSKFPPIIITVTKENDSVRIHCAGEELILEDVEKMASLYQAVLSKVKHLSVSRDEEERLKRAKQEKLNAEKEALLAITKQLNDYRNAAKDFRDTAVSEYMKVVNDPLVPNKVNPRQPAGWNNRDKDEWWKEALDTQKKLTQKYTDILAKVENAANVDEVKAIDE